MKQKFLIAFATTFFVLVLIVLVKGRDIRRFLGQENQSQLSLASGIGHLEKNEIDMAITRFQSAINLDPHMAEAHYYMGKAYMMKGLPLEAEAVEYEKAIQLKPTFATAHQDLGSVYANLKRYADAEKEFKKVLEINPKDAPAYNNLGYLCMIQEKMADAEKYFKRSMDIDPNYLNAIHNLAKLYLMQSRYDEAQAILNKSLSIAPKNAGAHYFLAEIAEKRHDKELARQHWEKAVELGLQGEDLAKAKERLAALK